MRATYGLARWGEEGWFIADDYAPVDPAVRAERAEADAAEAAAAAEEQRRFESEAGYI